MSSPFSSAFLNGQPVWSTVSANSGNFSKINIGGGSSIPEVGYGEGGYGQDGYDAPSVNLPGAATPNWTLYTTK